MPDEPKPCPQCGTPMELHDGLISDAPDSAPRAGWFWSCHMCEHCEEREERELGRTAALLLILLALMLVAWTFRYYPAAVTMIAIVAVALVVRGAGRI